MALHLSGFGATYARRALLESDRPPLQLVRPVAEAGDLAWLDGYFAVRALSARKGNEAVLAWADAMRSGKGWEEALQAAASESFGSFDEQYRAWTTAPLKELSANRQVYLDAIGLLRHQKEPEAVPILEAFVAERPLDLYAGNARYYLYYAKYRLGEYEPAIDGFTDLLVNASATTTFQSKAHYFLGRSYQLAGYAPVAAGEYRTAGLEPDNPLLIKLVQQRLKEVQ
jgi:tetratricopeptide (TPR) repeat protein